MKMQTNYYNTKLFKFPFILILLFGILIIAVSTVIYKSSIKYKDNGIETQAEITKIHYYNDSYTAEVQFTVDGITYNGPLDVYTSSMKVGDIVKIYYMEENPNDFAYGENMIFLYIIFYVVGAGLIIGSIITLTVMTKRRNYASRIIKTGYRRTVKIVDIKAKSNVYVNGKLPLYITCEDAVGKQYQTKVYSYYYDEFRIGDTVEIYTDSTNQDNYVFDLTSLTHGAEINSEKNEAEF